jgi:hypothetical protein
MSEQLPDDVRRFVIEHINSVEQLEVLLLLRAHPDQDWTTEAVGQTLYTPPAAAEMRLDDLLQHGFVTAGSPPHKSYRYRTLNKDDRLIAELADLYRERRVTVISLIYSKPHQQVQAFADAFKLRRQSDKD